jgi:tetratricopeptide (TPR) repeat protein
MGLFDFLSKKTEIKPEIQYFNDGKESFNKGLSSEKFDVFFRTENATSSNDDFALPDILSQEVKTLSRLASYTEAIDFFDKAIAIKSDCAEAWYYRGGALGNLGRYIEAATSLKMAVAIKPEYTDAWYYRGLAQNILGQFTEAVDSFDKVLALKPDNAEAYYYRGVSLHNLGHYLEAVNSFDKAIAIKSDWADAWYYRGLALLKLRQEGINVFNKVKMKVNGKKVVLDKHEWDSEAIASFDKAIAIKSDCAEVWYYRGGALGNLGR